VKSDTMFCGDRAKDFVIENSLLTKYLESIGQSDSLKNGYFRGNGNIRGEDECRHDNPIFVVGVLAPNRNSRPYKLMLVVWQRKTTWIGRIERLGGLRGDEPTVSTVPLDNMHPPSTSELQSPQLSKVDIKKMKISYSINRDVRELSKFFLESLPTVPLRGEKGKNKSR
jgi:hypothetical protein